VAFRFDESRPSLALIHKNGAVVRELLADLYTRITRLIDEHDPQIVLSEQADRRQTRFERTGTLADLDRAITLGQDAVDATPSDHPERPGRPSNLGNALQTRFEHASPLWFLPRSFNRDCLRRVERRTPAHK
jgi:hypothetical protein